MWLVLHLGSSQHLPPLQVLCASAWAAKAPAAPQFVRHHMDKTNNTSACSLYEGQPNVVTDVKAL